MDDPTAITPTVVTALEPPRPTALVDPQERRLLRKVQWQFARLCLSGFVAALAVAMALIHPIPWFIVQGVLLLGYTIVNGTRFDNSSRALDDYRIARAAEGVLGRKRPKELL